VHSRACTVALLAPSRIVARVMYTRGCTCMYARVETRLFLSLSTSMATERRTRARGALGYLKRKFEVCTWLRVYLPRRLGAGGNDGRPGGGGGWERGTGC